VALENIGELSDAGVDCFVVGNTVFSADDPTGTISKLKNI
jgi:pentose-5-phosphate-3-epimerase